MRVLAPALLLLVACDGTGDSDSDVPLITEPDVPTSTCAAEPYDWLPFDQVGEIISVEEAEDLSVDKAVIDLGLKQYGLDQFTPVPYSVRAWRVRYVTQDKGKRVEATAVLAVPQSSERMDVPTVVWAHGTTGLTNECAPSTGGLVDNVGAILIASQGWAAVQPDYIGMNGFGEPAEDLHPYLVVEPAATGTLDAVRALWNLEDAVDQPIAAKPTKQVLLWGASEGGFHALWADRYFEHYLPEGELIGTIAAVPPSDLLGLAEVAVQPGPLKDASAGLAAGMVGQATWYGDTSVINTFVDEPLATSLLETAAQKCTLGGLAKGIETVDDAFKPEPLAAARAGDWAEPFGCFLEEGTLRNSTVPRTHDAPVFFQVSGADELVVGSVIADDAVKLCDAGYRLDFLLCDGADHVEGAAESLPVQLQWAMARIAGEPMDAVCDTDDVQDCSVYFDF